MQEFDVSVLNSPQPTSSFGSPRLYPIVWTVHGPSLRPSSSSSTLAQAKTKGLCYCGFLNKRGRDFVKNRRIIFLHEGFREGLKLVIIDDFSQSSINLQHKNIHVNLNHQVPTKQQSSRRHHGPRRDSVGRVRLHLLTAGLHACGSSLQRQLRWPRGNLASMENQGWSQVE